MTKKILTVGVVMFFILNSVAFAVVGGMNFADQSKFDSSMWYNNG